MLTLGIVLIVLAVLFALGVSVSSGESTQMSVFGVDFGLSVPTLFFIGAITGIALLLGVWLTKKGLSRGYRRHKEVKELRQQVAAAPTAPSVTEPTERTEPTEPTEDPAAIEKARTVDLDEADHLTHERHTVAEGTESEK
jgi:hypothetical protein